MLTEEQVLEILSQSEIQVYQYIKEQTERKEGPIREPMKQIGEKLGLSEATVHRAVKKLRKQGVIGIVPSVEKSESNEIVYYGIPDPDKQVHEIFKMIDELSSSANRFETILKTKEAQIEQLKRDKELLYQKIDQLEEELRKAHAAQAGLDPRKIVVSQPLDDGTVAYIVKTK